ncbi:aldo/keto reductase [Gordonia spumicola]|uniref:Aldo/keto reductase n=1 Tax=Gordonia spumicola TaxID=589161 RepID=A0A7I9V7L9_9ACTN|nr:tyrosine-protein phosphatase [Gordonia spumicola]GEE01339.1 aldo/keto reductase [Gordonia spumicola]
MVTQPNSPESVAAPGAPSPVPSLVNLRGLGGWTAADGRTVRPGLLYRSADFRPLTADDADDFAALGVRTVYDFRSAAEREASPDPTFDGASNVGLDVLADSSMAVPANLAEFFSDPELVAKAGEQLGGGRAVAAITSTYRDLVNLPSARSAYRDFFTGLAGGDGPALFHCTAGKDRTGWAAAALLTLLGVSRDDVLADYLLTNERLVPSLQPIFDTFAEAGGDPDLLLPVFGVREAFLAASFDEVADRHGSIEAYFADGLGIGPDVQAMLRGALLA